MGASKPRRDVNSDRPSIIDLFDEGHAIDEALRQGVRDALLRHKRLGQRVATWERGRVVVLEPDQIQIDGPGHAAGRPRRKAARSPHRVR
jgi:hypothetical protein